MNDNQIEAIINVLRYKQDITDLEQDILDTYHELCKIPFDMSSVGQQIQSNDLSHPEIKVAVASMPNTVQKKQSEITAVDMKYVLSQQLTCLIAKELNNQMNAI